MKTVVLDAGHGNSDSGAVGNGYIEKVLNYQVTMFLKTILERCGINVVLTRNSDSENPDLWSRGQVAVTNDAITFLSIHFNAGKGKGFEAIYTFTPKEASTSAQWIGDCIAEEVVKLGLNKRGVWTKESSANKGQNWYGVLRGCQPKVGLILEGLFLDTLSDVEFLKKPDFLKNLAIAYAKGLCTAWGWNYVEENNSTSKVLYSVASPKSDEVKVIQEKLNSLNYVGNNGLPLTCDGWFGANTETAVKSLQSFYGLVETGNVDEDTYNKLMEVSNVAVNPIVEPTPTPIIEKPTTPIQTDTWKTEAMDYLKAGGFIKGEHNPNDFLTKAEFWQIMKNKGW